MAPQPKAQSELDRQRQINIKVLTVEHFLHLQEAGDSDRSMKFRTRGCAEEFLESENYFVAPSYILFAFVVTVENKIYIVNTAC